jgi:TonB family protein
MRKNKIEGRVIVTFVIEKNGSLSNIVVLRSPGYGSAEESARVMALSPKWKPGIQNGRAVRVQYTLPINFSLAGTDAKKDTLPKNGSLNPIKDHQATDHDSSKTTVQPSRFGITLTAVNDGVNNASALNNVTGKPIPPLYILDGKEMPNFNLSSLNPKDIESISVLKDKSAGALYGNKGAHGVVVITTKKLTHIQLKN